MGYRGYCVPQQQLPSAMTAGRMLSGRGTGSSSVLCFWALHNPQQNVAHVRNAARLTLSLCSWGRATPTEGHWQQQRHL